MISQNFLSTLCGVLCVTFYLNVQGQVVAPNFSIIGKGGESAIQLLEKAKSGIYPNQVSLDVSTNGVIYGFTCEYEGKQEIFDQLKAQIRAAMTAPLRVEQTNLVVWRNEQRKFSVQLSYMRLPSEEDEKKVRVIAISIDKAVRSR